MTYQVENLEAPIVLQLINSPVHDGSGFLARYGLLFDKPTTAGWSYANSNDDFRNLIFYLNHALDTEQFNKLNEYLARTALAPVLRLEAGRPRLYISPPSLHHLMRMEIAFAAEVGAKAFICQHCVKVFLTGPFTGRRSTAKYCRDRCRAAAQRQRANQEA